MPKLIHPDTGETVKASKAGAKILIGRGYIDPAAKQLQRSTVKEPAAKPKAVAPPLSDED